MANSLKIAIVSDLHCTYGGDGSKKDAIPVTNTYLLSDLLKHPVNRHPVESIKKVIKAENLSSDILLCPGDITDRINQQGLVSGWQFLKEIKAELSAKMLAITIGNHDVDSRNQYNRGPFELIKNLDDDIPTEDIRANEHFWRNDYCIIEGDNYILLIINSCFNHTTPDLSKNTRIDEATIEKIENDLLMKKSIDKIRIAMFHHHPMHHSNSNLTYRDWDFIDQSDKLLFMLENNNFNLVIHGHKHDPRLVYFNSSLPVLASGSFSATSNLLDIGAQNTFHIIEFDLVSKKGKIVSWIYSPKSGWIQKLDCYFPCFTGFGSRLNMSDLAKECSDWFSGENKDYIKYSEILTKFPDLDHIIPSDQEKFNNLMKENYGLSFEPNLPNKPKMLYKIST